MNSKFLISSLGWEQRFLDGVEDVLKNNTIPNHMIVFHPDSIYRRETDTILVELRRRITERHIQLSDFDLDSNNHVNTWHTAEKALSQVNVADDVLLDITTMPRHLIWACLHFLEFVKVRVRCIYYPPKSYGDWLSAETSKPKMVFRHSGIAYPDRQTCLLLFSGFDPTKVQQYVDFFEPKKIILIVQEGIQFENDKRCASTLQSHAEVVVECLSAYSDVSVLCDQLVRLISDDIDKYNIVATTVGPRCSTLALYALNREIPSIGLVYASSQKYNKVYSIGIDTSKKFESIIDFSGPKKLFSPN